MAEFGEGSSLAGLDEKLACLCVENCENGNTEWRPFRIGKIFKPVDFSFVYKRPSNQIKIGNEDKSFDPVISKIGIENEDKSYLLALLESCSEIGNEDKSFDPVISKIGIENEDESFLPDLLKSYSQIGNEDKSFYAGSSAYFDSNPIKISNRRRPFGTTFKYVSKYFEICTDILKRVYTIQSKIENTNQRKIGKGGKSFGKAHTDKSERADGTAGDSNQIKIRNREPIAALALTTHVSWVVIGSIIYCIGIGKSRKSKSSQKRNWPQNYESDVYCFDTSRPGQGWYLGSFMNAPRFSPYTLVLDGKLYVMGGVADIDFKVAWAEVYDPITGKWEALQDPPPSIRESRLVYAASHDDGERKILVGTYDKILICEYNLANNSWQILSGHDMKFEYSGPAVAFDGKLYWFTETGHLSAYDMRRKLLYKGRVDKRLKDIGPYTTLVHLGGDKFCLLWISGSSEAKSDSDSDDYEFKSISGSGPGSCFHCLKFEVSMGIENNKAWLKACEHVCQSFVIDADVSFMDAMLMDCWLGDETNAQELD